MKTLYFECKALDEVIIHSRASTEGANRSLKYIPGNVFLGIVAKKYCEFAEKSFDVFHSGNVVFGDAHLAKDGHRSLINPLTWFYNKGAQTKENGKLLANSISIFAGEEDESNQKKQLRNIFFNPDGSYIDCADSFSLKSAYDSVKRKSAHGKMYGYHALPAGTTWIFYIKGAEKHLQKIQSFLQGKHSIGKSKSSQYGRVEIKCLPDYECKWQSQPTSDKLLYIYADSLLSFVTKYGEATFTPEVADLGMRGDSKIRWDLSQVRPYSYSPYNRMRRSRDADRVCLAKGSVIVVEIDDHFDYEDYRSKVQNGIGVYRNEGMGQILINPAFVMGKNPAFTQKLPQKQPQNFTTAIVEQHESDLAIESWLEERHEEQQIHLRISKLVNEFSNEHNNFVEGNEKITSSQWSGVRSLAQSLDSYESLRDALFLKDDAQQKYGFLMRGKCQNLWQKDNRREKLKKFVQKVYDEENNLEKKYAVTQTFIIELCKEMAKRAKRGA